MPWRGVFARLKSTRDEWQVIQRQDILWQMNANELNATQKPLETCRSMQKCAFADITWPDVSMQFWQDSQGASTTN